MEGVLTSSQAAKSLGLSVQRIRQLLQKNRLAYIETPLGRLIPASVVEAERQQRARRKMARGA